MEEEIIDANPTNSDKKQYGEFGIRLLAYLIDFVTITLFAYMIWGKEVVNTDHGLSIQFNDEKMLVPLIYFLLSWILVSSSIGKLLLGLKIVDENGNKIKVDSALLRTLGYIILFIGCWFILGDEKKRALHDRIARTYVVKK
ncbi:MAG: RDD family protein [Crocinitomicaceae bacterium]|nr:RDD family protein [Crocinitomicaceae bacterium]